MCKMTPRYWRDPSDGSYGARCRCGWYRSAGDLAELQLLADDHRPPAAQQPPLKIPGFVSGLEQR